LTTIFIIKVFILYKSNWVELDELKNYQPELNSIQDSKRILTHQPTKINPKHQLNWVRLG